MDPSQTGCRGLGAAGIPAVDFLGTESIPPSRVYVLYCGVCTRGLIMRYHVTALTLVPRPYAWVGLLSYPDENRGGGGRAGRASVWGQ